MIIEGSISFRNAFQFVVKIKNNFSEGHVELKLYTVCSQVMLADNISALTDAQCHDGADEFALGDNLRFDVWLFNSRYVIGFRQLTRVVNFFYFAIGEVCGIIYVRYGCNHRHIKFTLETFLDNFHVK